LEECGPCPVFASFTLAFALQIKKKAWKKLSQGKENLSQGRKNLSQREKPQSEKKNPRKDLIPIVQEAGWAPALVWTGEENFAPHRDSIPGPSSP
jgi:hypothetical protein